MYVASIGAGLLPERMRLAQALWRANISAEYSHLDNPLLKKQMADCLDRGIPYMLIFGHDELSKQQVGVLPLLLTLLMWLLVLCNLDLYEM